jgi:hypothetical protein
MKFAIATDAESMAGCLYAQHAGMTWAQAMARLIGLVEVITMGAKPADETDPYYWLGLGQMAVDHIDYLPSRVAARDKEAFDGYYLSCGL